MVSDVKTPAWFSRCKTLFTPQHILSFLCLILGIFGAFLLLHAWLGYVVDAYVHAFNFAGFPTNGAFQLFNPLRRLAAGQTAGVDFQFFHGLGVVLVHYPLFWLFGKDLFASEMARWIMSPSFFIIANLSFLWAVTRKWYIATIGTVLSLWIYFNYYFGLLHPLNSLQGVRASMPVITAALLIWLAQKDFSRFPRLQKWPLFEIVAGVMLALTFFMGTEHGLAACLAYGITYLLFYPGKKFSQRLLGGAYTLAAFVLMVGLVYVATSGIHFLEPLKYALIDVPPDQFWYFGAPPNPYLASLRGLLADDFIVRGIGLGVGLFLCTLLIHYTRQFKYSFVILFFLVYGLLSNIPLLGYYEKYYTEPLARVNTLVLAWLVLVVISFFLKKYLPGLKSWSSIGFVQVMQIFFICLAILGIYQFRSEMVRITPNLDLLTVTDQVTKIKHSGAYLNDGWSQAVETTTKAIGGKLIISAYPLTDKNWLHGINLQQPGFFVPYTPYVEEKLFLGQQLHFAGSGTRTIIRADHLGPWMNIYVDGSLDARLDGYPSPIYVGLPSDAPSPTVWSTYASITEAENNIFQPSGYDYIIHALGPERRREYVAAFDQTQPDYVITMRQGFFRYEEWLHNAHWDFYERVVQNYRVKEHTAHSLIWERKPNQPWKTMGTEWDGVLTDIADKRQIAIPLSSPEQRRTYEVIVVEVQYDIDNPASWIPYIGGLPRYLLTPYDSVSITPIALPPYWNTLSFPLIVHRDQSLPSIRLDVASVVPGADFHLTQLRYRTLDIDEQDLLQFMDVPE